MLRRVLLCGGSLAVFILALLGLVGIFDALSPSGPEIPNPRPTPPNAVLTELARYGRQLDRELCVVVDGPRLQARLELQISSNEQLASALWRAGGPSGAELVKELFGTVSVAQYHERPGGKPVSEELTFKPPRLVSVGGGTARILTDSDPYMIGARRSSLSVAAPSQPQVASGSRKVTLDMRDGEVDATTMNAELLGMETHVSAPKSSNTELNCRTSLHAGVTRYLYRLDNPNDNENRPSAAFTLHRERTLVFWTSDVAGDTVPALDSFLWVGLGALPYAVVAWYLRRSRLRHAEATNVTLCVVWLLVATGILWTARDLLFSWDEMPRVVMPRWFSRWVTGSRSIPRVLIRPVLVIDSLVLVGALAWPLVCWALHRPASRSNPGWWPGWAGVAVPCIASAAAAAMATALYKEWSSAAWVQPATIPVAAGLGAIVGACLAVLVSSVRILAVPVWGVTALIAVAAVGAAAISPFAFTTLARGWPLLARSTYLFAVVCLAGGGAILLFRSLRELLPQRAAWARSLFHHRGRQPGDAAPPRPTRKPALTRRVVAALLAGYLLAVGILVLPRSLELLQLDTFEVGPWGVLAFVDDLSALLYVVVLLSVIVALRRSRSRQADARVVWLHRWLGVGFVVLNFYWFNDRWLYLPVPVLLGWVLAVWWLLPNQQAQLVRRTRWRRAATGTSAANEGMRLLELARAERRHHALVSAGTGNDLETARAKLDGARQEAAPGGIPPLRDQFFGIPDGVCPWVLGAHGAVLGALLGIPWMVVLLIILVRDGFDYGTVAVDRYPALWMFAYVFGALTQWPLYGLFLGYFFPYLRGRSAVWKALAVLVTLAVPPLVFSVLWWRGDWLRPTLWWVLQAFVFFVALGMLMDYRIARNAGVETRSYIEIRGLSTVVGWGGTFVLATVTAVITLLQGTAALYVQNLLNLGSGGKTPGGG